MFALIKCDSLQTLDWNPRVSFPASGNFPQFPLQAQTWSCCTCVISPCWCSNSRLFATHTIFTANLLNVKCTHAVWIPWVYDKGRQVLDGKYDINSFVSPLTIFAQGVNFRASAHVFLSCGPPLKMKGKDGVVELSWLIVNFWLTFKSHVPLQEPVLLLEYGTPNKQAL